MPIADPGSSKTASTSLSDVRPPAGKVARVSMIGSTCSSLRNSADRRAVGRAADSAKAGSGSRESGGPADVAPFRDGGHGLPSFPMSSDGYRRRQLNQLRVLIDSDGPGS